MTDSKEKSTVFAPILWESSGHLLLMDGANQYWYSRIHTRKQYEAIQRMCRRGHKGRVYQHMKKHYKFEFKVGT
jgi:hypothetical protein